MILLPNNFQVNFHIKSSRVSIPAGFSFSDTLPSDQSIGSDGFSLIRYPLVRPEYRIPQVSHFPILSHPTRVSAPAGFSFSDTLPSDQGIGSRRFLFFRLPPSQKSRSITGDSIACILNDFQIYIPLLSQLFIKAASLPAPVLPNQPKLNTPHALHLCSKSHRSLHRFQIRTHILHAKSLYRIPFCHHHSPFPT